MAYLIIKREKCGNCNGTKSYQKANKTNTGTYTEECWCYDNDGYIDEEVDLLEVLAKVTVELSGRWILYGRATHRRRLGKPSN